MSEKSFPQSEIRSLRKVFFRHALASGKNVGVKRSKILLQASLHRLFDLLPLISDENYSKFRQVRKLLFCSCSFHAATAYACVSKSVELNCIKLCTKTEDNA